MMRETLPLRMKKALFAQGKKLPNVCVVCGSGDVDGHGMWEPNKKDLLKFDVPQGKTRAFVYALCGACKELPGVDRLVEERLLEKYEVVLASDLFPKKEKGEQ